LELLGDAGFNVGEGVADVEFEDLRRSSSQMVSPREDLTTHRVEFVCEERCSAILGFTPVRRVVVEKLALLL
jgi:hypothetical protein